MLKYNNFRWTLTKAEIILK